nr:hypothetical protein [Chlamydiota bacterium]
HVDAFLGRFEELPDELKLLIFNELEISDMASVVRVSQDLERISQEEALKGSKGVYDDRLQEVINQMEPDDWEKDQGDWINYYKIQDSDWKTDEFLETYRKELKYATSLDLKQFKISSDFFNFIFNNCPNLKSLRINTDPEEEINEEVLKTFPSGLTNLTLYGDGVTDAVLEHLKTFSGLKSLFLYGCHRLTEDGFKHLGEMKGLTVLSFDNSSMEDKDIKHLASLTELIVLNLTDCTFFEDAGLMDLKALTKLRLLNLYGCYQLSEGAIEELREALPDTAIITKPPE